MAMFDFGINVLLNPSSFIGPANQVISVINQLQGAMAKFNTSTGGGGGGLEQQFTRLNQVIAQSKSNFESVGSSTASLRSSMGQIGQAAQQATQGFSIFGSKLNEALQNTRTAESTFKSLGPAFAGVSSGASQAGTALTGLGTAARTTVTAITPLGNLLTGMESRMASTASTVTATANTFKAGLSPSIASIGGPLNSLNSSLGTAGGALTNLGNQSTATTGKLDRLKEMFSGNRGLVFGASALFGTLTGIVFEYQLVADASGRVAQSQAVVNDMIAKGEQGTGKYAQAVQSLGKDQRFLEFSTRNMALAFTNLIPDVLLITNGIIQLTDKLKTVSTGASAAATGMQSVTTAMTASNTATTAINTAMTETTAVTQALTSSATAVTGSLTPMRGALTTTATVLAETATAESAVVLTSEGLVAANAEMGVSATGASRAIQSMVPAIAETGTAEATLIEENVALGASFDALGVQAKTAGSNIGNLGKTGGIKGALSGLLSGGGALGIAGPIGLGVGAAFGFGEFLNLFAQQVKSVVDTRLLAEAEIEKANKGMSDSFMGLGSDIGTSIDEATGKITYITDAHTQAANTIIANNDRITQSSANAVITPGAKKGQTVEDLGIAPNNAFFGSQPQQTTGQQGGGGGKSLLEGSQFGETGQTQQATRTQGVLANRTEAQIASLQRSLNVSPGLITQAGGFNAVEAGLTLPGRGAERQGMTNALETFMKASTAQGAIPTSAMTQKILPDFAGAKVAGELTPERLQKILQLQTQISEQEDKLKQAHTANNATEAALAETTIAGLKAQGTELLTNVEADKQAAAAQKELEAAQSATDKVVQQAQQNLHKHNEAVLAMPTALAEATGQELEFSRAIQTGMGVAVIRDQELEDHIALMAQQATAYTNSSTAASLNLKTQEELVKIGNAVVGGVEEELTHVTALNAFWGNLSTTMQENIQTNQQLTISSIDITAALTNQAQNQFLVNEGTIAGKEAAQQFAEELVSGAAQTKAYNAGILLIADTMGVKLPSGIKATIEEVKAAEDEMAMFQRTTETSAEVINRAFGESFANVGKLVEAAAEGGKEFSKAWKEFDLGDVPSKLKGFFKDMVKDMGEGDKQFKQFTDLVDLSVTALETKTLSKGRATQIGQAFIGGLHDVIATGAPQMKTALAPIEIFINNLLANKDISKSDLITGLTKAGDVIKTIVTPAFKDHIPTAAELADIEAKVSEALGEQISVVTKAEGAWNKYFSTQKEVAKGADQFKKGIGGLLDFEKDFGKKEESKDDLKDLRSGKKTLPDLPGTVHGTPEKRPVAPQAQPAQPVTNPFQNMPDLAKTWEGAGVDKGVQAAKNIQTQIQGIQSAIQKVLPQVTASVNATGVGIIQAFTKTFTTVEQITGTFIKAVAGAFTALSTVGRTAVNQMGVGIIQAFTKTYQTGMELTGVFIKAVAGAFTALSTVGRTAINQMGTGIIQGFTKTYTTVMEITGTFIKAEDVAFESLSTAVIASVATMSKGVQTEISAMFGFVTQVINSLKENVIATISVMQATVVTNFQVMEQSSVKEAAKMADTTVEVMVAMADNAKTIAEKMADDVVAAVEDMDKRGSSAANSFASSMQSSMSKVESAASNAASAVSNLADEVADLDGASAEVTITTTFKTKGSPPSGGSSQQNVAHGLLSNVIAAASPKSFAEGGIETVQGPRLAFYGDNPGGIETHAFIPHDNPSPILKKLAKMFGGKAGRSEIIDSALNKAEEIIVNATFVIENVMDGEKVGRTITKKTFRKLRTR